MIFVYNKFCCILEMSIFLIITCLHQVITIFLSIKDLNEIESQIVEKALSNKNEMKFCIERQ